MSAPLWRPPKERVERAQLTAFRKRIERQTGQRLPDYAALAQAYGADGYTAENEDELEVALRAALTSGRTCVIDARVDPREHCFPMIPAGAAALDLVEYPDEETVKTP